MSDKKCSCCGNSPCTCSANAACPVTSKLNGWLCIINKIMHIIVFIALAMVLFDVHGMLKAQREYANAVTAAVANSQASGGNAANAGSMTTGQ